MQNPDCYKCKHRRDVPGDKHSRCAYPGNIDTAFAMLGIPEPCNVQNAIRLNIQADEYGFEKGWFNWPANYDPTWLRNCDGFVEGD